MKVAINAQLLSMTESYRGAGVSNYSWNLLKGLGQQSITTGTQSRFVAFTNARNIQIPGIQVVPTHRALQTPLLRIAWEQALLPLQTKGLKADVIHGLVNVLPLASNVPGVITVHDLSFVRLPDKFLRAKRIYLTQVCKASVEKACHIIAVSQQTASDLIHFFGTPAHKITVIYNGVDEQFCPIRQSRENQSLFATFRQRNNLPERYLLHVGTLEPRKNLELLLKAFACWQAHANEAERQVKLVLVGGKGWLYQRIFELVRELGITKQVLFPGFVPSNELPDWYRASEGFVYPSLFEGFGLPVLEAMACGTPVLCSRAQSLIEIVDDSALTFSNTSEKELVAQLALLTSQPALRAELRQRGVARSALFSWQRATRETLSVYELALK